MRRLKTALNFYILPISAVFAVALAYEHATSSSMQLCKHQYALCTSASCVPQSGDPTKAVCLCDVEEGPSMSTVACNTLQPSTNANGIRTLYSTFSLNQYKKGKRGMKCPSGTPWTWCLNKRCTVDPSNPKQALCVCDVKRTGEWTTFGGDCDTSTCQTGYWSGATFADLKEGSAFMTEELKLDKSEVKWCQGEVP